MAGDIDEERILPKVSVRRTRFDPVHADAAPRERLQHAIQRAGTVADEHQQRGAVVARRRERFAAQHQEAGGVVAAVLDRAGDLLQAVHVSRRLTCDRRCIIGVAGATGTFSVAGDRDLFRLRQVRAQPAAGLRERLRMRVDAFDVLDAAAARQQVLVHAQLDFAAYLQRRGQEQVQRDLDGPLPGVLHRHHAEIGIAGGDFLEHFLDAGQRQPMRRVAEMLVHRLLAEGAFRPEIADLQRLLLGQAGRHDFAEQPHQHFVGERAVIAVHYLAQHLRFALGSVIVDRGGELALGLADLVRPLCALGDQRLDLPVDAVDLFAHRAEIGLRLALARRIDLRLRGLLHGRLAGVCLLSHGAVGTPA